MEQSSLKASGPYYAFRPSGIQFYALTLSVPMRPSGDVPVAFAVLQFVGPEEWLGLERGATVEFASQHGASSLEDDKRGQQDMSPAKK